MPPRHFTGNPPALMPARNWSLALGVPICLTPVQKKGHPQCYRKTSGTKQNEGRGGAPGIKSFPAWVTHVRPEKCGHYSSLTLLGAALDHDVRLKRKYLVTEDLLGKESVTALQGSEDRHVTFEPHLHPLALDSEQST